MLDSGFQIEVDRSTPTEWSSMLDYFSDANIYQTWSYGSVCWGRKNLSHLVVKRNGDVVGVAQLRIIRPAPFNFGIAYLRWGPICHRRGRELDVEAAVCIARALHEEYVGRRGLVLKVMPNAFVESARGALFQSVFSNFVQESIPSANAYRTFVLDLAPPLEEVRRRLDKKWRNQLSRSEKNELKVVAGKGTDEYSIFCRMYKEMRKRKAFATTVDIETFRRIQEDLPLAHRMQILICEQNGIPVAGLVASAIGDSAIYLLGATSDDGLNSKGAYLLQWTLIQWLKENGFRWYDLGGVDPGRNPGVYHFKSGMSGADVFHIPPFVMHSSGVSSAIIRTIMATYRTVRSAGALRVAGASSEHGS
jgi:lipid II:glycine glycyltransferase (peptidoglycan interpeptide bridge formation enzyme)